MLRGSHFGKLVIPQRPILVSKRQNEAWIVLANLLNRTLFPHVQKLHSIRRVELGTITRFLQPKPGEKILDIGCGKGFYCGFLASKKCVPFGIDPLENDIALARQFQSPSIEFKVSQGERLPFEDQYFDKAVSVCVLEHTGDDRKVLNEANRVLKRNGILSLSVDSLSSKPLPESYKSRHKAEYHVNHLYDEKGITALLNQTGFDVEQTKYLFDSPLSSAVIQIGSFFHFRLGFILLFPIFYPLLKLDDWMAPNKKSGMILVVKARKK